MGRLDRHLADEVLLLPRRDALGGRHGRGCVGVAGRGDVNPLRASFAEPARQPTRVQSADRGHVPAPQQLDQLARRLEHGGRGMRDDQAAQPRPPALVVPRDSAVVADQRIGHQHDLARVGRIGADLLVAAMARVHDEIAAAGHGRAERNAVEHRAVLERQERRPVRADAWVDHAVNGYWKA